MKAAVLHELGGVPQYEEVAEPVVSSADEVIITVKAASIKNLDRARAAGTHYDVHRTLPAVVGVDGVGILPNGQRVYTGFADAIIAEKAVVNRHRCVPLPDGIDDVTAAALPNPGLSAWFSLKYRAAIQPGDKVLVLGATGVTGKMAVQLAKLFGAGCVVATGRNPHQLAHLRSLGADVLVSLAQDETAIAAALKAEHAAQPFDIVIDYLWGNYAEMVLQLLTGHSLTAEPHRTRFVQVGAMAGNIINLKATILRSSAVELYGIGGGTIPLAVMKTVPTEIMPQLVQWVAAGKLIMETEVFDLKDVAHAWVSGDKDAKRVVIRM